jgi:Uma2 family endonuclease
MATATIEIPLSSVPDPADPFRYGWRYVQRERDDGTLEIEQVPLTLEDVLHPREGDQVTHSAAHQRRLHYLRGVFEAQLADDPTAVVLDDVRVAWDVPGLKAHGPDIAVIFGVREREKNWSTFDVAAEGVRPALIVELTSPETAALDRSPKLEEYELAGVPLYVIIDGVARRREPTLRLFGFAQSPTGYRSLATDERGRLWLAPVRLWLGVEEDELVCYDEADRPLGDYRALAAALAAETRGRAEAERQVEDARRARVEAERRAEAEQQGRLAAEARLRALEDELRQLRGGAS